jgi:hypothetical protein
MFQNDRERADDGLRRFLAKNGDELKGLADSDSGKAVRRLLGPQHDALKKAAEAGDTAALSAALKDVVSTEEGRRLVRQLSELLGK